MEQIVLTFIETNSPMYMGLWDWCYSSLFACRPITNFIRHRNNLYSIYSMSCNSVLGSIYDVQLTKWDSDLL